ncbi:hypothetical protein KC19_9G003900 [Ceratodon purpureus]|uniref:Nitronate monooxygenase domain-containing protein n=1 Tax=Ceratodon purpureus TaxID=3225 RepID=A0A8T0GUR2_CERPU|nr:hypothetical protein KC19_9G003900 [Ceratodon purpureus]
MGSNSNWGGILGLETGIVQAPMGPDIAGPALVAAVANAGGLGFLRAPSQDSPDQLHNMVAETRKLTSKPFGVGIILSFPHEKSLKDIYAEKVGFLQVSWGEFPKERVAEAHEAGVKVLHQVGSVEEAVKAADAGVDAIIAQGVEAGGHVQSQVGLLSLLPSIVDAVKSYHIPVIAAGGIVDGRGYVAALALGAQGICMGTRFLATTESYAHPVYKQKIVEVDKENSTEYTDVFGRARWPGAPHRVVKTPFFETWKNEIGADESEEGQPAIGTTTIFGKKEVVPRFSGKVPNATTEGEVENMALYAGMGAVHIKEIVSAASVVKGVLEEAQAIIELRLCELLKTRPQKKSASTMV